METDWVSRQLQDVAERVILPRFGALREGDVEEKRPGDLVTVADREAEAELVRILSAADPGSLVVGEEGVFADPSRLDALPTAERAWVIDPVDGTRNFSRGSADFAVMLAEVRRGETVRAWIWQPVHRLLYVAEHGGGVLCNDLPVPRTASDRAVPLGATYVPLPGDEPCAVDVRRSWGSCGIDYPKLLAGEVDFLTYRSMFPWDHLPGGLMVREFGGRMASEEGVPYRPGVIGRRLIAVMDPGIWSQVRDALVRPR